MGTHSDMRAGPSRATVYWAVLILVAVLLAAVAGEVFLRLVAPQAIVPDIARLDPRLDKMVRPDVDAEMFIPGVFRFHIRTDERGFRIPRAGATCNGPVVAVMGDSFAFGIGVEEEESFGGLLRQALGARACVHIAAVPGTGLTQQLAYYEEVVRDLEPRLLILATFDNDILDCDRVPLYRLDEDKRAQRVERHVPARGRFPGDDPREPPVWERWLRGWSHLYSFFFVPVFVRAPGHEPPAALEPPGAAALFEACLRRLARLTREAGTRLVVVTLPGQEELADGRDHVGELVAAVAQDEGFARLDPAPALRAANAAQSIWFAEGHFDARGHRAVFDVLEAALGPWERLAGGEEP